MKNKIKYLKFEPRKVMSKNDIRLKTLLIERIKVGAINDLYTADMRRDRNEEVCSCCGSIIGDYHNDRCTQEMCPRCGELCGHCKCTDEYAVYPTECTINYQHTEMIETEQVDMKADIFSTIMATLQSRFDNIEAKLDKVAAQASDKHKSNFAPRPIISQRKVLLDPPYVTSRDKPKMQKSPSDEYLNNNVETLE